MIKHILTVMQTASKYPELKDPFTKCSRYLLITCHRLVTSLQGVKFRTFCAGAIIKAGNENRRRADICATLKKDCEKVTCGN